MLALAYVKKFLWITLFAVEVRGGYTVYTYKVAYLLALLTILCMGMKIYHFVHLLPIVLISVVLVQLWTLTDLVAICG